MHWHGLFLPNKEDGVPYLTQMPIKPGTIHKYTFPIIQNGTYWYHSHSGLQEQIGLYGLFIINKKKDDSTFRKGIDDLPTVPVILSEWTDLKPENVQRMLHNADDWFGAVLCKVIDVGNRGVVAAHWRWLGFSSFEMKLKKP